MKHYVLYGIFICGAVIWTEVEANTLWPLIQTQVIHLIKIRVTVHLIDFSAIIYQVCGNRLVIPVLWGSVTQECINLLAGAFFFCCNLDNRKYKLFLWPVSKSSSCRLEVPLNVTAHFLLAGAPPPLDVKDYSVKSTLFLSIVPSRIPRPRSLDGQHPHCSVPGRVKL